MLSAPKKILWLDNDPFWIDPYVDATRDQGHDVNVATTVSEAESFIKVNRYHLLILDVKIPTKNEEEEQFYSPKVTQSGTETGLAFYRRMKRQLEETHISILVVTIRFDKEIQDAFIQEGLSPENFSTKLALREIPIFLAKIKAVLG